MFFLLINLYKCQILHVFMSEMEMELELKLFMQPSAAAAGAVVAPLFVANAF